MTQPGVAVITKTFPSPTTHDRLRLQVHPRSAHTARRAAYSWAVEHRFPDPVPDDFATVTDELTSNAVKAMSQAISGVIFYPYGTHFTVSFGLFVHLPCVRVWDACPVIPDPRAELELDEFAEAGRGLTIVRALTAGFTFLPGDTGKVAMAVMPGKWASECFPAASDSPDCRDRRAGSGQ